MRISSLWFLLIVPTMSGCLGLNPFCSNESCGKSNQYRDSFCNCADRPGSTGGGTPTGQASYYMIARYSCKAVADGSSAGDCSVQSTGTSCQDAKNNVLQDVLSRGGDPCVHCTLGVTDHTKQWDGQGPSWIQGGPCWGETSILPASNGALYASIDHDSELVGRPDFTSDVDRMLRGTDDRLSLLAISDPDVSTKSCLDLCPKEKTQNGSCSVNALDSATGGSVGVLREWVTSDRTIITPKDLYTQFKLQKDECHRGPTNLTGVGVTNDGPDNCYIRQDVPDADVTIQLMVPQHLEAKWNSKTKTAVTKLTFQDPLSAPEVLLFTTSTKNLDPLSANFGGVVKWVEADNDRLFVRVPHGCVGVIYKSPTPNSN
jgi:hypothetical protein